MINYCYYETKAAQNPFLISIDDGQVLSAPVFIILCLSEHAGQIWKCEGNLLVNLGNESSQQKNSLI